MDADPNLAQREMVPVVAPGGEHVLWPEGLLDAIGAAAHATFDAPDYRTWRPLFAEALVLALHAHGILLAPRGFQASRESVNVNVYSMMLAGKQHAESTLHHARTLFRGDACSADLHGEFHAALQSLTGHAPLVGVGRVATIDDRLRCLRELLLHVPLDQEPSEPPVPIDGFIK